MENLTAQEQKYIKIDGNWIPIWEYYNKLNDPIIKKLGYDGYKEV